MSDHAVLVLVLVITVVAVLGTLVLLGLQLRDSRRMTRAMDGDGLYPPLPRAVPPMPPPPPPPKR